MPRRYRLLALLGLALALVWLNLRAPAVPEVVAVAERVGAAHQRATGEPPPAALPAELSRPLLEPADRDPFVLEAPTQPVAPQPVPPPVVQVAAPVAPPLNLRFAGRVTSPDGSQTIYVAHGDTSLAIAAGQVLPNGYRVEAIHARSIDFNYPPLNTTASLELPEPPRYEIR